MQLLLLLLLLHPLGPLTVKIQDMLVCVLLSDDWLIHPVLLRKRFTNAFTDKFYNTLSNLSCMGSLTSLCASGQEKFPAKSRKAPKLPPAKLKSCLVV